MRTRRYETVLMLPPDLEEGKVEEILARLESVIDRSGGLLVKKDDWGVRKLAYEIRRYSKGRYFLLDLVGQTKIIHELERHIKMIESIMRFLTVKKADEADLEAARKEQAEEKEKERLRKAAALERRAAEKEESREQTAKEEVEPEAEEAKAEGGDEAGEAEDEETAVED